jgi:chemotaxis family two-component system sensor kinase Cph1
LGSRRTYHVFYHDPPMTRCLEPGDHICVFYSSDHELADTAADFIAEGLRSGERCWFVPTGTEGSLVRAALRRREVDVAVESRRGALEILASADAYVVHGDFNPEATMNVFSDEIENALRDGFSGFRAAAEMSWALAVKGGAELLTAYEALLRSLFTTSRATGLCLYDRRRMPLEIVDGALVTHPMVRLGGGYHRNPFYNDAPSVLSLAAPGTVDGKLADLDRLVTAADRRARHRKPRG